MQQTYKSIKRKCKYNIYDNKEEKKSYETDNNNNNNNYNNIY